MKWKFKKSLNKKKKEYIKIKQQKHRHAFSCTQKKKGDRKKARGTGINENEEKKKRSLSPFGTGGYDFAKEEIRKKKKQLEVHRVELRTQEIWRKQKVCSLLPLSRLGVLLICVLLLSFLQSLVMRMCYVIRCIVYDGKVEGKQEFVFFFHSWRALQITFT